MPKAERGTPKDIANRMKAKGLQKLKFYCQMCEKQCRDANGFKCHLTSESHLRQMKIFSDNAGGILDKYSKEFEQMYMTTLRMRHGTKRVNANNVYQEVISDKYHIHMNATHWVTLSDFVQYLGKTGKCVVEETERGWYVSYIERDASILARQEALQRRLQAEKAAEVAQAQRMEIQRVEAAKALDRVGGTIVTQATKLEERQDGTKITVSLASTNSKKRSDMQPDNSNESKGKKRKVPSSVFGNDDEGEEDEPPSTAAAVAPLHAPPEWPVGKGPRISGDYGDKKNKHRWNDSSSSSQHPKSTKSRESRSKNHYNDDNDNNGHVEKIDSKSRRKQQDKNNNNNNDDYWLYRNIVVRVISKSFANGKYFKKKGIIDRILQDNPYIAEVEMLSDTENKDDDCKKKKLSSSTTSIGGDIVRLDQEDLETVIPKTIGSQVRILMGKYRGEKATVLSLDKKRYEATLQVEEKKKKTKSKHDTNDHDHDHDTRKSSPIVLKRIPYEEFSKLA